MPETAQAETLTPDEQRACWTRCMSPVALTEVAQSSGLVVAVEGPQRYVPQAPMILAVSRQAASVAASPRTPGSRGRIFHPAQRTRAWATSAPPSTTPTPLPLVSQ